MKFERLVRQKRFVGAVGLLNESLLNIFSRELVDVPAVSSVRDEMLVQKGRILDTLVEEIADVLFLRAATTRLKNADRGRGAAKNRRRRERGGAGAAIADDISQSLPRAYGAVGPGGGGLPTDAASESTVGEGDNAGLTWAGLDVDVTDVRDDEEDALDDPSQEFSVYLRLLVEAVRRLRCLDDVERYLLERLPNEIVTLSAMHMRACAGKHEEDEPKSGGVSTNGTGKSDVTGMFVQRLAPYLSLVFDSFTSVLANHMHFVRLLHAARLRDVRDSDPGEPVFEADAPYKEALVLSLWQHIQTHLKEVLTRHVGGDSVEGADKTDTGGVQGTRLRPGLLATEPLGVPSSEPNFRPLRRPESSSAGLVSAALDIDHANATEYCRTCLLADPSPLVVISIFRPTLKFVEVEQVMCMCNLNVVVRF